MTNIITQLGRSTVSIEITFFKMLCSFIYIRYSRYEKNRSATLTPQAGGPDIGKETASLIDLGDEGDRRKNDVVDLISDIRELSTYLYFYLITNF